MDSKKRQMKFASWKPKDTSIIGKNIGGYIPICIKSSRGYGAETEYFCRNALSKELARVKISELNLLGSGKEVYGLPRDKVVKNKVGL